MALAKCRRTTYFSIAYCLTFILQTIFGCLISSKNILSLPKKKVFACLFPFKIIIIINYVNCCLIDIYNILYGVLKRFNVTWDGAQ